MSADLKDLGGGRLRLIGPVIFLLLLKESVSLMFVPVAGLETGEETLGTGIWNIGDESPHR